VLSGEDRASQRRLVPGRRDCVGLAGQCGSSAGVQAGGSLAGNDSSEASPTASRSHPSTETSCRECLFPGSAEIPR
jgi:hypothetical protein